MKNFRLALIILLAMSAMNAARAGAITEEVKQRVQADLQGKCLEIFLEEGKHGFGQPLHYQRVASSSLGGNAVFAFGEINSQQYCGWALKGTFHTWEDTEKRAIASCETVRSQGGAPCEVYAHNNDIVYVSIHEKLKTAKKLFEAGDVPAAERALNEVKNKKLSKLSADEAGEYEYLFGEVLANSKTEKNRAEAIDYLNHSWYVYKNVNGAVEEGNLRTAAGDIDKNWRYIRSAYQYFLANASDEQKTLHPEVEQNLKQTEQHYQADLAQKEEAAKERARLGAIEEEREAERKAEQLAIYKKEQPQREKQAKIDAINAKREAEQQAKQERLDAAKAEREAQQQEKIRQAEAKRIAKEGDGSADDLTCKSYGAQPGTQGYINCRIQLSRTKQLADEQQAAQARAASEQQAAQIQAVNAQQAAQAENQKRLAAAQQAAQAQRAAIRQQQSDDASNNALMAIGIGMMGGGRAPAHARGYCAYDQFGTQIWCGSSLIECKQWVQSGGQCSPQ